MLNSQRSALSCSFSLTFFRPLFLPSSQARSSSSLIPRSSSQSLHVTHPNSLTGEVIIFVGKRAKVDSLVEELTKIGIKAGAIHGDLDQVGKGCSMT